MHHAARSDAPPWLPPIQQKGGLGPPPSKEKKSHLSVKCVRVCVYARVCWSTTAGHAGHETAAPREPDAERGARPEPRGMRPCSIIVRVDAATRLAARSHLAAPPHPMLPPLCLQQLRLIARDPSRSPLPRRQLARARRFWVGWDCGLGHGTDGRLPHGWFRVR
jgi:hypothetical protein